MREEKQKRAKGRLIGCLCVGLASLCLVGPAQGAPGDPLFVFTPSPPPPSIPPKPILPPPTGYLNGPCGLAVDSAARFYIADYYHRAIDVYSAEADYSSTNPPVTGATGYLSQVAAPDPLVGPCGLMFDGSGSLYANNYHRNVTRASTVIAGEPLEDTHPTGVAADTAGGRVYVNQRTHISVYDSLGNPLEEGGEPLVIGEGSLGDAYGIAVSQFPATSGRIYVPDAASNTVKVYDPLLDKDDPIAELKDPFNKPFVSLRDSAIAVDRVTGEIYFADNLQPAHTERPQALIYVYTPANAYNGHLKYNVIDALPPGLAVDNSAGATQGRVYVTSGNTDKASVYAYSSGSRVFGAPLPPLNSGLQAPGASGASTTTTTADEPEAQSPKSAKAASALPKASLSTITQSDNLRVSVEGKLSPKKLPREGDAPISVSVGWQIETTDGTPPPRLKMLEIQINRHGRFSYAGLPTCPYAKIQPATTQRALQNCRSALVGRGSFSAEIALKGQEGEAYEANGKLLVFNGENEGKPVLFGQIYSPRPFATSFVITFAVKRQRKGTYGTSLAATLPKALRSWGNLTAIEMKLERRYGFKGKQRSYISAGCPAPKGFGLASFRLARTEFSFNGGKELSSTVVGDCRVRG
jgi:hypothetical protein